MDKSVNMSVTTEIYLFCLVDRTRINIGQWQLELTEFLDLKQILLLRTELGLTVAQRRNKRKLSHQSWNNTAVKFCSNWASCKSSHKKRVDRVSNKLIKSQQLQLSKVPSVLYMCHPGSLPDLRTGTLFCIVNDKIPLLCPVNKEAVPVWIRRWQTWNRVGYN